MLAQFATTAVEVSIRGTPFSYMTCWIGLPNRCEPEMRWSDEPAEVFSKPTHTDAKPPDKPELSKSVCQMWTCSGSRSTRLAPHNTNSRPKTCFSTSSKAGRVAMS